MRIVSSQNSATARRSTLDELEARLNQGEAMINQLRIENKPIGSLEEHWLHLLRQYEYEFRAMQDAA